MRVAVIGGGVSGLACAWLLDPAHQVTLYERAPRLGGHVRTLGGNVDAPQLPAGLRVDAGVIEYDRDGFPAVHAWLAALGTPLVELPDAGASSLYLANGRALHSPALIRDDPRGPVARARKYADLVPLALEQRRFFRTARALGPDGLAAARVGDLLGEGPFGEWVRCLLMYAYSTPYPQVDGLAATLAVPMLRLFLSPRAWCHRPGGAATYVDAAAAALRGPIRLGAQIEAVRRTGEGVRLRHADGAEEAFDAVILAVPPHRTLALLADATADERRWFAGFTGGEIETLVHTDPGPYRRRGSPTPSEFDLFEVGPGRWGYNAWLNRLIGLPPGHPVDWGLAFALEAELDPARVVHRQAHDVALYTREALAHRAEVVLRNGEWRTWHVGAWLGDGLHESAVRSALAVAERLGGRSLPV